MKWFLEKIIERNIFLSDIHNDCNPVTIKYENLDDVKEVLESVSGALEIPKVEISIDESGSLIDKIEYEFEKLLVLTNGDHNKVQKTMIVINNMDYLFTGDNEVNLKEAINDLYSIIDGYLCNVEYDNQNHVFETKRASVVLLSDANNLSVSESKLANTICNKTMVIEEKETLKKKLKKNVI